MHVVIVGCGRVGSEVARLLDGAGHSVAIVDRDREAYRRRLEGRFSGRFVAGSGFDRGVLEAAGTAQATGFVAVTSGDNTNIVAARIARETFEVREVVAGSTTPGGRRCTRHSESPPWPRSRGPPIRCCDGCFPGRRHRCGVTPSAGST